MQVYDKKKQLKQQFEDVKGDYAKVKVLLDDYILNTVTRHTDRDIQLLDKIKRRTDEKAMIQKRDEEQDRRDKVIKDIISKKVK